MMSTNSEDDDDEAEIAKWENRELGATEEFVKVAPSEVSEAVDESLGLATLEIRMQKTLIEQLTLLAQKDGIILRAYIRKALGEHVERSTVEELDFRYQVRKCNKQECWTVAEFVRNLRQTISVYKQYVKYLKIPLWAIVVSVELREYENYPSEND